jgi:hypothetical protein
LESFPKHSFNGFQTTFHVEILERLSLFIHFLPVEYEKESEYLLADFRFRVERIPHVLQYLDDFAFDEPEDVDEEFHGFIIGKKRKQSQQKKARKMKRQNSSMKQQDLEKLGISDPQTKEEASLYSRDLLEMLKEVLSVRLVPSRPSF